ncbi:MAG: SDR family oxidoreductase [Gammaproteobacteria bacterium]
MLAATLSQQALRKTLEPADVLGTVMYLASEQSAHTTGQTLMVDGGTVFCERFRIPDKC